MYQSIFTIIALLLAVQTAAANSEDTRLRLEQQGAQQQRQSDADSIAAADALRQTTTDAGMNTDAIRAEELPAALYLALQQQRWDRARAILLRYRKQPGADPLLTGYARGTLARVDGDYRAAISHLQAVVTAAPADFLLPRLALARAQFENHDNQAAKQNFDRIAHELNRDAEHQQGVIRTVDTFLSALQRRRAWQGVLSVGVAYDDNINQSSGARICLLWVKQLCAVERSVAPPVSARKLYYEAVAERRFTLSGQHGVFVRGIGFGDVFDEQSRYSKHQIILNAGYSFQNAGNNWSVGPVYKHVQQGQQTEHSAWGINASWRRALSARRWLRLGATVEKQRYQQGAAQYNGSYWSLNTGLWQSLGTKWLVFGQVRLGSKNSREKVFSYREADLRARVSRHFDSGFSLSLESSWHRRRYGQYSALLGARRQDTQQHYSAAVRAPRWQFKGLEPSLKIEYIRNRSSVDWLYSYNKTLVAVQLQKQF